MTFERGRQRLLPRGGEAPQARSLTQQRLGLPPNYLKNGYFDQNGNPLPEIIIEWPQHIAAQLDSARMAPSQLRNFFSEVRRIEGQLSAGQNFEALRGRILQLDAYAANAVKKDNAPLLFKQFIEQNSKWAAKDKKSFLKGFMPHFESVVAYFPKK